MIYTCEPGHVARGSLSRECLLGGTWSGSEPTCEFVDCDDPTIFSTITEDNIIVFVCNESYLGFNITIISLDRVLISI